MNCWLTVAFLVASIGGAFSLYSAISVGSTGLANMATNLQSLSVVMNNYYTALNADRTVVNATLNDLGNYVNVAFAALNKTYGVTQPSMSTIMPTVSTFNQTLGSGEYFINSQVLSELNQVSSQLQQAIDSIFMGFQTALYSMSSYDQSFSQEKCVAKNMTQMSQISNSLGKLGSCLQQEVNTANTITPTIVASIKMLKNDLIAYINLLQICQPTSKTCIEQYFLGLPMDMATVQSALYFVQQYASATQYDAATRNRICGQLINADIQDQLTSFQNAVSVCSNPQM